MPPTWSPQTRERAFYIALGLSALSVAILFLPFLDVVLFASVVAVVVAPVHERITRLMAGRRLAAATVTTLLLGLVVFGPAALLFWYALLEGLHAGTGMIDQLGRPETANWLAAQRDATVGPFFDWLQPWLPADVNLLDTAVSHAQTAATQFLEGATVAVPSLLGGVTNAVIDGMLFAFTVVVILADGTTILSFLRRLSPLDDAYERRLLDVFKELATNMVVGGLATAAAMGLVATVGHVIFGVPRPVFFGLLTAVASFAPVIGTAVVAGPLVVWVGLNHGWAWAGGLLLWSVVMTGSTDNLLRPLFMRGSSNMHPLLLFFAVFGGMYWLGLTGILVGPVLVAFFLTLATLHKETLESWTSSDP